MKIVIISDTHGDFYELKRVAMIENGANMFLHAGDVEAFGDENISPFAAVKGNCDYGFSKFPKEFWAQTPYGLLYMRHYPYFGKEELESFYQKGARILVHGHTHIKENKMYKDMFILCPGSLTKPRDGSASYLVLDVTEKEVKVIFKTS